MLVVGGGPAGAATAIGLARTRPRRARPRAGAGLALAGLRRVHLAGDGRRAPARRARTTPIWRGSRGGSRRCASRRRPGRAFRLTYGDDGSLARAAVGLDRSALDPLLLERARAAGAEVREGVAVRSVRDGRARLADGTEIEARVVVGADGLRSVVARDAGVARRPPLGDRPALTFHVADPEPDAGPGRADDHVRRRLRRAGARFRAAG